MLVLSSFSPPTPNQTPLSGATCARSPTLHTKTHPLATPLSRARISEFKKRGKIKVPGVAYKIPFQSTTVNFFGCCHKICSLSHQKFKMTDVYQVVSAVGLLFSCLAPTSADFNAAKGQVSLGCLATIDQCMDMTGFSTPTSDSTWCLLTGKSYHGISCYQCLVQIGLCTDEEFTTIKNEACGEKAEAKKKTSTHKTAVYKILKSASKFCQSKVVTCVFDSSLATVLKQQEMFCELLAQTSQCLDNSCKDVFKNLNDTACKTRASPSFPKAILATSKICRAGFDECLTKMDSELTNIRRENYCDAIAKKGDPTHSCVIENGCTEKEFTNLKNGACN